jgi:hypothetical protein
MSIQKVVKYLSETTKNSSFPEGLQAAADHLSKSGWEVKRTKTDGRPAVHAEHESGRQIHVSEIEDGHHRASVGEGPGTFKGKDTKTGAALLHDSEHKDPVKAVQGALAWHKAN